MLNKEQAKEQEQDVQVLDQEAVEMEETSEPPAGAGGGVTA